MQKGRVYNIKLNHITTTFHTVTVLAPDGVTSVHEYWPEGRQVTGSYIPWIAPESSDYYLRIWNPGGDTGDYTLITAPAAPSGDDHAAAAQASTHLSVGQGAAGNLDHQTDVDYFRFKAEMGQYYSIQVPYQELDNPRISSFSTDGITPVIRDIMTGRREAGLGKTGKYIDWKAIKPGDHYFVI